MLTVMALCQLEKAELCCAMFPKEGIGKAYVRKILTINGSKVKWEDHADLYSSPTPS